MGHRDAEIKKPSLLSPHVCLNTRSWRVDSKKQQWKDLTSPQIRFSQNNSQGEHKDCFCLSNLTLGCVINTSHYTPRNKATWA